MSNIFLVFLIYLQHIYLFFLAILKTGYMCH